MTDKMSQITAGVSALADSMDKISTRFDAMVDAKKRADASGTVSHIATISAYPNKFGTFSGNIRNELTREIVSDRFQTLEEARSWVRSKSWEMFGPVKYAAMQRKGEYLANVWKSND